MPKRDFPKYIEEHFLLQDRFEVPRIIAKGGQKLTSILTEKIVENIEDSDPKSSNVHVLILGDNDLRSNFEIKGIIQRFEQIVETASKFPNCYLVISSLIHGISFDKSRKEKFFQLDKKLRLLVKAHSSFCRILNLRDKLIRDLHYVSDCVHLNKIGARVLADSVFNSIRCIPHFEVEKSNREKVESDKVRKSRKIVET
jgi:hypothetical protein